MGGSAIILDGELATGGDTVTLNFASPYMSGDFIMSLASSFSYNGPPATGQVTTVDVADQQQSCLASTDQLCRRK